MQKNKLKKQSPGIQKELKILAIQAVQNGKTLEQAAQLVGYSRGSIYIWVKQYRQNELEKLATNH